MEQKIQKVMQKLGDNRMQAFYAENREGVCDIVRSLLFEGCTVTAGGSVSLKESGVWELLQSPQYRFFDRSAPGISEEQRQEAYRTAIGCDFFFCSSNAVTENGELVNVDGLGNRVSSICFGPKSVVMVVGSNKIVRNVEEGLLRVKKTAAPLNAVRLALDTPCAKLGHCVSLEKSDRPAMTDGCYIGYRICDSYLISARQHVPDRIKVILCGEKLGY